MIINIEKILYNENKILNKNKLRENWFKNNLPFFYEKIENFTKVNNLGILEKFSAKIWHFHNDVKDIPKCEFCLENNKRFTGFEIGYDKFCSKKCAAKSSTKSANETRRVRTLEKWGVEHTSKLRSVKEKQKQTNLQKYGFVSPSLNPIVEDRRKKTMLKNWGVEYSGQNSILLNKSMNTRFEKYKDHVLKTYDKLNIIDIPKEGTLIIKCEKCQNNYEIKTELLRLRYHRYKVEPCLSCNPLASYKYTSQNEIYEFLRLHLLESEIIKSDREVLNGREIDILVPHLNLAIEFNGLYWHSELYKSKEYHLEKKIKSEQKGINLIHIWEDDWIYKKDIVKSRILNTIKLNGEKIWARKCEIRVVSTGDSKKFNETNHLQGNINASYKIGLYYKNELVSLMTFGRYRRSLGSKSKDNEWELYRFSNKLRTSVVGGFSKLLNRFVQDNNPEKIITYALRDWSSINQNVYEKNGFKFESFTPINYWYFNGSLKREHRFNFRKDKLLKMNQNEELSEREIMRDLGWNVVFDSGNIKYSKTFR
jgi:hypothetical protein